MKKLPILLIPFLAFTFRAEPLQISWKRLTDVQFTRKLNKELGMHFLYPAFGPSVNALQGKEISIRGYMIPVDENDNIYVISAKPMAACFFCGGAGPESIMELQFRKKKQRFRTDEVLTVRGRLVLNASDIDHLNYILKDAEVID
ncbi:DUF3299 domain-containing protein [Dyadobacter endophyticus]|jgi:hypothetical protein|uniref:DUF3299 domain-containing protein n=1 Tax=Dyadobacter endophyticus TaxID=1749036 RepID=A0ABQ1ZAZ1_9BACT|nr:DUF3299 domain-containing protein [Dyadobacter endophyticus]GGH53976.1 hypothetical protein GCM10007423_60030 [Dyadobacter endophyticus]